MKNFEEIMNLKGSFDFGGEDEIIRNYISDTLKKVFEKYGYKPLSTSILCYYDLLALKYDEENDILNEIYKVSDQGKRKLALRYDLTVPFAKYIANNPNIKLPYKRYEIGKVFRDGPVKKGRAREFIQCDVDSVGIEGQMIEAELIALYIEGFLNLGIEPIIKYNNRKLMIGLIELLDVEETKIPEIVTIIDKIEKLSKEEIIEELNKLIVDSNKTISLIENLNLPFEEIKNKFISVENNTLKEGIEELKALEEYIEKLNLKEYVEFSSSLARGQEYYTGTILEVYPKDKSLTSSIGGGGRYDNMVGDFIGDGKKYPAVGISFGLDAIFSILKNKNNIKESMTDVYIIPMGNNVKALEIAKLLRDNNINVDIEMNNKKLKKALDFANTEKVPYVIILGEDELKENKILLKDMNEKIQEKIDIQEIVNSLKEKIYFSNIEYKIYNPGGNKTGLVENKNYTDYDKKKINEYILNKNEDVEQVGFISKVNGMNYLEMAGKEFCINASRCAAYEFLNGNKGTVNFKVSGATEILTGRIENENTVFVDLKINKLSKDFVISDTDVLDENIKIVNLDGITQIIINEDKSKKYISKLKSDEEKTKQELKELIIKIENAISKKDYFISKQAVGIILLENENGKTKINPVVWVRQTDTLYYETSCGSGSIATGIYKYLETKNKEYEIKQVSGYSVFVKLDAIDNKINSVEVSGEVAVE